MDAFADLIAQTGTLLGIDGLEPDAEGVVEFVSEEATIVVMLAGEASDMILVTAKALDAGDAAYDAARRAMEANFAEDATISLDPDDGSYHLSDYAPLDRLTPEKLVERLENFASALVRLRGILSGKPEDAEPISPPDDLSGFMRV